MCVINGIRRWKLIMRTTRLFCFGLKSLFSLYFQIVLSTQKTQWQWRFVYNMRVWVSLICGHFFHPLFCSFTQQMRFVKCVCSLQRSGELCLAGKLGFTEVEHWLFNSHRVFIIRLFCLPIAHQVYTTLFIVGSTIKYSLKYERLRGSGKDSLLPTQKKGREKQLMLSWLDLSFVFKFFY